MRASAFQMALQEEDGQGLEIVKSNRDPSPGLGISEKKPKA